MATEATTILDKGELCSWVAQNFTQGLQVWLLLCPAVLKFVEQTNNVLRKYETGRLSSDLSFY